MFTIFQKTSLTLNGFTSSSLKPYPPMFHKHAEIIYVLDGSLDVCIDNIEQTLNKGDIAITFPYIKHSNKESNSNLAIVLFDPKICGACTDILLNKKPANPYLLAYSQSKLIRFLIQELIKNSQLGDEVAQAIANSYLIIIIGKLLKTLELQNIKAYKTEAIQRVLTFCTEHFNRDIRLEDISEALNISKTHITHLFSENTGYTFREYLNYMRINHAKYLLQTTNKRIIDIMLDCGYNNQSTFNYNFIKICGITPRDYRKKKLLTSDMKGNII